jgi:glycolate oxidase
MIGSEGILGLITSAEVRLRRVPPVAWTAMASFARIEEAAAAVSSIIAARIDAAALELLDHRGVEIIDAWSPSGYPTDSDALLFAELVGEPEEIEAGASRLLAVLRAADPEVRIARTPDERARLWAGRLGFVVATTAGGKRNFVNDVTVPRQRIPEMVTEVRNIAARHGLDVPIVAHAGDGNVHPVILYEEHERQTAFTAASEMTDVALELGGTITGEHGVGSDKITHMAKRFTPAEIASFHAIKLAFDPELRLNPGVLLPEPISDQPVDRLIEAFVTAALSHALPHAGRSELGSDTGIELDEENLSVGVGASASCEDVRTILGQRRLRCEALEGAGVAGDVMQDPTRRAAVRSSLLAITSEMPHGRVRFGSSAIKDVAGLDAKRLMASASDSLGTLLRADFRVRPA